jgi:hypothetical protein
MIHVDLYLFFTSPILSKIMILTTFVALVCSLSHYKISSLTPETKARRAFASWSEILKLHTSSNERIYSKVTVTSCILFSFRSSP